MDNQPFQPFGQPQNQQSQGMPQFGGGQSMPQQGMPEQNMGFSGQPMPGQPMPTAQLVPVAGQQSGKTTLFMVISIVAGLVAVTFIGLFVWMYSQWSTAQNDVDSQIDAAVATAVKEKADELENQFVEREKYPYNTFAGPADYGELTFEYPKTWSVYVANDASNGGDFQAYLNPDTVYMAGSDTVNALRVTIKGQAYDDYIKQFEGLVKDGRMSVAVRPVGGESVNVYTGQLPGTNEFQGIVTVFKIRDKTAAIQTDAMLFADDYYRLLDSVKFNQ
ncbi:hypothetical protein J6S35_01320 [Candidatus Saccharibacteria bacterium]|nr:hypothetical protein [Candidatus Saccharibacteria bacterium]